MPDREAARIIEDLIEKQRKQAEQQQAMDEAQRLRPDLFKQEQTVAERMIQQRIELLKRQREQQEQQPERARVGQAIDQAAGGHDSE